MAENTTETKTETTQTVEPSASPDQTTAPTGATNENSNEPVYEIPFANLVDGFIYELRNCPADRKIEILAGKDHKNSEGGALVPKDKKMDEKMFIKLKERMLAGTIDCISIKADDSLIKLMKESWKAQYKKYFDKKSRQSKLFLQLLKNVDQIIPSLIENAKIPLKALSMIFNLILKKNDALLEHLFPSSLFCLGISVHHPSLISLGKVEKIQHNIDAMLTGLFSDISFHDKEFSLSEDKGGDHAQKSGDLAKELELSDKICGAIRNSHAVEDKVKLPKDNLIQNYISLCEFYIGYMNTCSAGKANAKDDDYLEQFFFDQGVLTNLEFFDKDCIDVLAKSFKECQKAQEEGASVSELMNKCPYQDHSGSLAVPYPFERNVTQMLCRGDKESCHLYEVNTANSGKIYFAKSTKIGNPITRVSIDAGFYGKCMLERELPANKFVG